ncbi:ankyrin repeat-containing domain protein [Flagelloscypha sp. PMI_526]|nr:ankyrin repeat-containing domain protein [Flagelloscypha sp. PMI_526]
MIFRDINTWLQPIHQTSKLDSNIRARSGTTCQWLLQNHTFIRWMKANRGLFWLHGLMGTGKTVISSFVIETLRTRDDIYVAFYYFEFTNSATLSEEALLRSLIAQLAVASSTLVRALYQKHNNGSLQPQLSTLHSTLNELVSASSKPIFIVIDALDELPLPQRKYLLQSLLTSCKLDGAFRARVMVTSREEVDICREFETIDFELGVQGDLVRQDIAAFVDRQLEAQKWTLWPRDEIEMMRRLLNERADRQFRMVACQMDILQQVKNSGHLREALQTLPKDLSDTYNHILEKIPLNLRVQAHRLFAILSFASTSISVLELSALLAVDFGEEENSDDLPEFRRTNHFHDPLDVIDLGRSLVSQGKNDRFNYLQLAHASVKEHLLSSCGVWFSLKGNLAHGIIARSCLALLLEFQILQDETYDDMYPYSRLEWYTHVLPNGPPQLLQQQRKLSDLFPWSNASHELGDMDLLASAAFFGLFDFVQMLLSSDSWDADTLANALVSGAASPHKSFAVQCCGLLISCGAPVNAVAAESVALSKAAWSDNCDLVRYLVEKGANVNMIGGQYGTPLQTAASRSSLKTVQYLVEQGAYVNTTGGNDGTPLYNAVAQGKWDVVQYLVEQGADVNVTGGYYGSALQAAAVQRNLDNVQYLVEHGAVVNTFGGEYGSALHAAAHWAPLEFVQYLVEQGADVNAIGKRYGTPLHVAAYRRKLDVIQYLVERGADVKVIGGQYGSVVQAAAVPDVYNHILQATAGCLSVIQYLVAQGAEVNVIGGIYGSDLQAAALGDDLDVVRYLVDWGADVSMVGGRYGALHPV